MAVENSTAKLFREIKHIICESEDDGFEYPVTTEFVFCRSIGKPLYKITITRTQNDIFIDEHGHKWVRVQECPENE
jgi:hypothetical protein